MLGLLGLAPASDTPAATEAQTRLLVLIDRSGSVRYDVKQIKSRVFQEIDQLQRTGDGLGVAYIHAITEINARSKFIDAPLSPKFNSSGGSTQKKLKLEQEELVLAQQEQIKISLAQQLSVPANAATKPATDVWGSLATIQTFFRGATAADRCVVYYVSDMVESMPAAGRRDFERHPPADDASALQAMAMADVPLIRKKCGLVGAAPLSKVDQVVVLFPKSGVTKNQNNAMSRYWTAVFAQLGLGAGRVRFE